MMEDRGLDTPLAAIEHAFNRSISGEFASAIVCRDSVVNETVSGAEVCRKLSLAKSPPTFSLTEAAEVKDRWASRSTKEGEAVFGKEDPSDVTTVPQSSASPSAELSTFPSLSGSYISSPLLTASPVDIGDGSHRRASTSSSDVQCSLATPLEKFVKAPACSESGSAAPSPLTTACTHIASSPGSEAFPGASDGLVDTPGLEDMQRTSSEGRRPSHDTCGRLNSAYLLFDSALCAESFGPKDGVSEVGRRGGCSKASGEAASADWTTGGSSRFEGFSSPKQPSFNDEVGSSGVSLDSAGESLEYAQLQTDDASRKESDGIDENRLIVDFQLLLILLFDQVCHMVPDLRRQDGGAFYSFHLERIVGGQLRPTLSGYAELLLPICSASSLFEDEDGLSGTDEAGVDGGAAQQDSSLLVSAALRHLIRHGTVPPAKVASVVSRCPAVVFIQVVSALQSVYNLQRLLTPEAPVFRQQPHASSSPSEGLSSRSVSLGSGDAFSEESMAASAGAGAGGASGGEMFSPSNPQRTPQSCAAANPLAESPAAASLQRSRGGGPTGRRGKGPGGSRAAPAIDVSFWKSSPSACFDSLGSRCGVAKARDEGVSAKEDGFLMRGVQSAAAEEGQQEGCCPRRDFGLRSSPRESSGTASAEELGTRLLLDCSAGPDGSSTKRKQPLSATAAAGSELEGQTDGSPRFISASVNKRRHPNIQAEILNTCCPERLAERSSRLLGEVLQKLRSQEQHPSRHFGPSAEALTEAALLREHLRVKSENGRLAGSAAQAEAVLTKEASRPRKRKASATGTETEESTGLPLGSERDDETSCGSGVGAVGGAKSDFLEEQSQAAAATLLTGQFKAHGYALRKGAAKKAKRSSLTTEGSAAAAPPTVVGHQGPSRRSAPSRTQSPGRGRANGGSLSGAGVSSIAASVGEAVSEAVAAGASAGFSVSPALNQHLMQLTSGGDVASNSTFPAALSSTMRGVFFNRSLNRWVCTWSRNGKEYQRSWSAGKFLELCCPFAPRGFRLQYGASFPRGRALPTATARACLFYHREIRIRDGPRLGDALQT